MDRCRECGLKTQWKEAQIQARQSLLSWPYPESRRNICWSLESASHLRHATALGCSWCPTTSRSSYLLSQVPPTTQHSSRAFTTSHRQRCSLRLATTAWQHILGDQSIDHQSANITLLRCQQRGNDWVRQVKRLAWAQSLHKKVIQLHMHLELSTKLNVTTLR